ncbi:hypothetical protein [Halorubrum sp. GN11_10-6_MGM]|uniref:hypothetical protein n=1 Tax=Halorubrum sp. GN11_10-6_MGM TaxID=2518112 RepID=UPI001F53FD10|nr:hypothetical protein [Halorubrum sp. GN11_10-6_MGM]
MSATDEKTMCLVADSDAAEVFFDLKDSAAPDAKPGVRGPPIDAIRREDWSDRTLRFWMTGINTEW